MLRMFLQVCLLEMQFDYIEYQHIPRYLNTLTDALVNHVLNRHLQTFQINNNIHSYID